MATMSDSPGVSVIVPTYHEAANLRPLTERLFAAAGAADLNVELILVDDDSQDGSERIVADLARTHAVRIVTRHGQRGLSSAVLAGFEHATGAVLVVMDADLQHPPEAVPQLVACIASGAADFAIGSRYAGGSVEEHWSWWRRFNSWGATLLARPLTRVRDPMSGFFALHRDTWRRAAKLNPLGYKIGLELLVKCGCTQPEEIPITFAARHQGRSKLTAAEQFRYLRHLLRLYRFRLWG